jgi:sugar phosphate isomerase/epimerase
LTISDVQPSQLVDIAADTGYDHICLFVKVPYDPGPFWRVNSVAEAAELKHRLSDRNVSVYNTDTFMVTPDADLAGYHETLDVAAALGAKTINSLVTHHDRQACAEKLRTFADLAA